jgi:hypothetical protein
MGERRWKIAADTTDYETTGPRTTDDGAKAEMLKSEVRNQTSGQPQMDPARQSRNRRQEGVTADYADYAENRLPPGSPPVYRA